MHLLGALDQVIAVAAGWVRKTQKRSESAGFEHMDSAAQSLHELCATHLKIKCCDFGQALGPYLSKELTSKLLSNEIRWAPSSETPVHSTRPAERIQGRSADPSSFSRQLFSQVNFEMSTLK